MAKSLEDRVRALEADNLRNLALINACKALAVGAWCHISLHEKDPVAFAQRLIATWRQGAEIPRSFPGADPSYLDALSQVYQQAIEDIAREILPFVQAEAARLGLPRKD